MYRGLSRSLDSATQGLLKCLMDVGAMTKGGPLCVGFVIS